MQAIDGVHGSSAGGQPVSGGSAALRNLGWLIAEKGARFLLNTVVGFVVARHLGPDAFGSLAFALAVVGFVQPLAELGLELVMRLEFIRSPHQAPVIAGTAGVLRLAGGCVSMVLVWSAVWLGWVPTAEGRLVGWSAVALLAPTFCVGESWLHARLAARSVVLTQIGAALMGSGVRVVLVLSDAPAVAFAITTTCEAIVGAAMVAAAAWRSGLRWGPFERAWAIRLLRAASPLFISAAAVSAYMRTDAIMLRAMVGEGQVGLYSAAVRFTEIWFFLPPAMAASLLPMLLRSEKDGAPRWREFFEFNSACAIALAAAVSILAAPLVKLAYGPMFAGAIPVAAVYAWSLPFIFLGVARTQALVSAGLSGFYAFATFAGLLLNAGLNLILIPKYGAAGAAAASVISQMFAGWISSYLHPRVREIARLQTRALLYPWGIIGYVRRTRL